MHDGYTWYTANRWDSRPPKWRWLSRIRHRRVWFRAFSLSSSPLALSSMACIATMPHFKTSHTRLSLLSRTYTIGTASTRDTTYLVHFCWLTVSPSGVSESTSQRGRASKRAHERASERTRRTCERAREIPTHFHVDRPRIDLAELAYAPYLVQDVQKSEVFPTTGCLSASLGKNNDNFSRFYRAPLTFSQNLFNACTYEFKLNKYLN